MVATSLLLVLLSAAPVERPKLAPHRAAAIDARERLNDTLERYFDREVCAAVKSGLRTGIPDAEGLVHAASCSMRALELWPERGNKVVEARLLWEIEGWEASGARRTHRGEARAKLRRKGRSWTFESFEPITTDRPRSEAPAFRELPADAAGIVYGPVKDRIGNATILGGLGVVDLDDDGLPEVLVTAEQPRLFKNLGAFRFEEVPLPLELPRNAAPSAPAIADFDGDGDPDVVIPFALEGKTAAAVFRNDEGKLVRAGEVPTFGWIAGSVPWDFDADGVLDLVFVRYGPPFTEPNHVFESTNGDPPLFFRGKGDLTFSAVPLPKGLRRNRWGLAAIAADLLGEGREQLYVANDFGSNDLYSWQEGTLRERADEVGLRDPGNGMSADVGDVNADGRLDLYVANMFSKAGTRILNAVKLEGERGELLRKFGSGNTLYVAGEDGKYTEVGQELGVNRGLWAWGSLFVDYDNDARLDVAVATGYITAPDPTDL